MVFGGYTASFNVRSSVWIYDTVSDHWQPGPWLKVPRAELQGAQAAGKLYAIGGDPANPRYVGFNEAFPCQTMGAARPDPDVYFARVPLHGNSGATALKASSALRLQVRAFSTRQQPGRLIVQAQGTGVETIGLQLYDLSGQRILQRSAQGQRLTISLADRAGRPLANGVYLYVITVQGADGQSAQSEVRKLVVLR